MHPGKLVCANSSCHRFLKWLSKKRVAEAKSLRVFNDAELPEPPPYQPPQKPNPIPRGLERAIAFMGLPWPFDQGTFQSKFRELSKKYHPDYGGDSDKFMELMSYRELLKNQGLGG
jgi:hypothetical protein